MSRLMGDWSAYAGGETDEENAEPGSVSAQNTHTQQDHLPAGGLADRVFGIDALKTLVPPDPLIDGLVYQSEMCQLTGAPGTGKSFVSLGWACAIASGQRSWEGHRITRPGPVVYVAAEGVSGLWLRIAAWCQLNQVDPELLSGKLFVLGAAAQLGDINQVTEVIDIVREREAVLTVFDTRARMTVGLDENSSQDQGKAIRLVDNIIHETKCAVVVVHHSSRSGTAGRGSSAWDGAVFSDLRLGKEKGSNDVEIECAKHKDAPDGCRHQYTLKAVTVAPHTMPDRDERQRATLVAVQAGLNADANTLKRVEADIISMYREFAPDNGLTVKQAEEFALTEKGIARATFFRNHKRLIEKAQLVDVGNGTTKRYVAADNTFNYGEDNDAESSDD